MSQGRLAQLAADVDGVLYGGDQSFDGVSTDTRSLAAGELFVALRGPNYDGSDFVARAAAGGAAGALVERRGDGVLPEVVVPDTRVALGRYASAWREQFVVPVIAITGSNGKTTVKEMVRAILATRGPALATRGNLNNDIGLPLTLLDLDSSHRCAVVELGANHPGEIDALARIARPTVGLVNNAGPAHLEGFGTVEGVARGKGELFAALDDNAIAVINADDPYCELWQELAGNRRKVLFGRAADADVRLIRTSATRGGEATHCEIAVFGGAVDTTIPLPGEHNALNATAAAATAASAGFTPTEIAAGLAATQVVSGRMRLIDTRGGARIVDDAYNANPESARAAVDFLAVQSGRRWLVLGDMGELGPQAGRLHGELGAYARDAGIDALFATGPLSRAAVEAFGNGARWHDDVGSLIDDVAGALAADVTVLVKGSRTMRLERVVAALIEAPTGQAV